MTGGDLLGLPAVLIFGLLAWMILRSRRVSIVDALVFLLFGFYLASTWFATFINALVTSIPHLFRGGS
jgi:hypothetical protein